MHDGTGVRGGDAAAPVRTVVEHRDIDGRRRQIGEQYETTWASAFHLERAGYVQVSVYSFRTREGRVLTPFDTTQYPAVETTTAPRWQVLQLTQYDPGNAAYRYHSAANAVESQGVSAFVRFGHSNPFCDLRQFDGGSRPQDVRTMLEQANVVHVHMDYSTLESPEMVGRFPDRTTQMLLRHYHGSDVNEAEPRILQFERDAELGAALIAARLWHLRYSDRIRWVPIPMPCDDYRMIRDAVFVPRDQRRNFRLAHSPTNAQFKGTIILETAVSDLRLQGVPIELVMIRGQSHGDAIRLKATCDGTFDSFWLGIQGSGLEAASMGQVVLAGDPKVRQDYRMSEVGECPYTFVEGFEELREMLRRVVMDETFAATEAARVEAYTRTYHDYRAVGARYWRIIEDEWSQRSKVAA